MYIIENPILRRDIRTNNTLSFEYFAQGEPIHTWVLAKLRYSDICLGNNIKPIDQISHILNTNISPANYLRLASAVLAFSRYHKSVAAQEKHNNLNAFLGSFRRGSRKFRNIITNYRNAKVPIQTNTSVRKFYEIHGLQIQPENVLERRFKEWHSTFYTNGVREFIFRFNNNLLALNTKLSHFVPGKSRGCTFCEQATYRPCPDETSLHLFFECSVTTEWRSKFLNEFLLHSEGTDSKSFWFSFPEEAELQNEYLQLLKWFFLYNIWDTRQKYRLPSWTSFKIELNRLIDAAERISDRLKVKKLLLMNRIRRVPVPQRDGGADEG